MTRKRSRNAEGAQTDESESPRKIKIVDVSNQVSDEENQGTRSDCEAEMTEKVSKKELIRKMKPKRYVKKKENDLEIVKISVVSKDGASASTGNASKADEDLQKLSVPKEKAGAIAMIEPDHLLGVNNKGERFWLNKPSDLEREKAGACAVTDSERPSSADREVEDLLSAMFSVAQDKDDRIVLIDSDSMEDDDSQTDIPLIIQKTDEPPILWGCNVAMKKDDSSSSKNELSVECCEVPHEKNDSIGLLLMDLEDTPVDFLEQSHVVVVQVEGLNNFVNIPSDSNPDSYIQNDNNKVTNNVANGSITILNLQSTEKTVTENDKKVACNRDEEKFNRIISPPSTTIIDETLSKIVKERNDKVKTQATLPLTNHSTVTIHTEDEISCKVCEQKIKMTLEGTDIFHSNLIVRNEDGTKVPIENIKTTYSVRCKNKHLCYFDFEMMEKMKMVPAESSSKYNFIHIEDDISCKRCKQRIKLKLEGIDFLHSNMVLLDEDENTVSIENVKTTYSVNCKNQHLCNFDFGLMEKEELQFEEKIDCWEKLKVVLWNAWKKVEVIVKSFI